MIELENITYYRKKQKKILDNISFKITKGECIGIIGANGAGKTTLFRTICGAYSLYDGRIRTQITEKDIVIVPEEAGIYLALSAMENLCFRGRLYGVSDVKQKARAILGEVGLGEHIEDKSIRMWSNGMKKRLSLACGLLANPKLMILDEPTNGVDIKSKKQILDMLNERKKNGMSFLISSHDVDMLSSICTRYIFLKDGRLVYDGILTQEEVKQKYIELC